MAEILSTQDFLNRQRQVERENFVRESENKISPGYWSDIRQYQKYCSVTDQSEGIVSLLNYLYDSIVHERVKKSTWEKRVSANKRYLTVAHGIDFERELDALKDIGHFRKKYREPAFAELTRVQGKKRRDKDEILAMIEALPTRERAICMVNLTTASRPSEMVALKVKHFDLEDMSLEIYIEKQKKWYEKRLDQATVRAVRQYIREYKLDEESYLVGRIYRNGRYESREVTTEAYRKFLTRTLELTAYNLRKTQVSSMHEKGADIATIAKQTGHSSTQILAKHYLNVSDKTVDKYL